MLFSTILVYTINQTFVQVVDNKKSGQSLLPE